MKGKIIAAVAAAVCIVPIAYTLTAGQTPRAELTPDKALLPTHVDVPDAIAVAAENVPGSSPATEFAPDHATAGASVDVVSAETDTTGATSTSVAIFPAVEQQLVGQRANEAAVNNQALTIDQQPALVQTYQRTIRSASVLSPTRQSSAPTIDSATAERTIADETGPTSIEVAPDALTDLSEPVDQSSGEPTPEYIPIVSTLSPALDHVLPTDELVEEPSVPTSVPEPGTLALFGLGLLAAGAVRRRSLQSK